jgi:hypothetical protein
VGSEVQILPGPPLCLSMPTIPWGLSSAGRAPALQAGGHRFDPDSLHHSFGVEAMGSPAAWSIYLRRRVCVRTMCPAPESVGWADRPFCSPSSECDTSLDDERLLLVLKTVNQVLVRHWACCGQPSLTGCLQVEISVAPRSQQYVQRREKQAE